MTKSRQIVILFAVLMILTGTAIFSYPFINMTLKGMAGKIEYMQFLHDGSEIIYKEQDGDVQITLPVEKPDVTVPVVEIFLK